MSFLLDKLGWEVTAIDNSAAMIEQAQKTAKAYGVESNIKFLEMDAAYTKFPSETFDAIVSRYSSWTFTEPETAYQDWYRILKGNGILLNFDANWVLPTWDCEEAKTFEEDEQMLIKQYGEFQDEYHNKEMVQMMKQLPLAQEKRPSWDSEICKKIGFSDVNCMLSLGDNLWNPFQKQRYHAMPTFLIKAIK